MLPPASRLVSAEHCALHRGQRRSKLSLTESSASECSAPSPGASSRRRLRERRIEERLRMPAKEEGSATRTLERASSVVSCCSAVSASGSADRQPPCTRSVRSALLWASWGGSTWRRLSVTASSC
eukprot:3284813-Rhodomonas_salina.1